MPPGGVEFSVPLEVLESHPAAILFKKDDMLLVVIPFYDITVIPMNKFPSQKTRWNLSPAREKYGVDTGRLTQQQLRRDGDSERKKIE